VPMNNPGFSHYLITRFNIPVDHWKTTRKGDVVLSEEWLSHRFRLFETFCLPSVRNQVNQDFKWLVLFGADTPEGHRQKVATIAADYQNLVPLYINHYSELLPTVIEQIRIRLTPSTTHVITSRLDNDDGLHKDYVSVIQGAFEGQSAVVVDIPDGYDLSIEPPAKIGTITAPYNPFISLIEEVGDPKTVFSRKHPDWAKDSQTITIRDRRLWLRVIHEQNMQNTHRGGSSASFQGLHADFGIPQQVVDSMQSRVPRARAKVRAIIRRGLRKGARLVRLARRS
jgi:hypothetical protein